MRCFKAYLIALSLLSVIPVFNVFQITWSKTAERLSVALYPWVAPVFSGVLIFVFVLLQSRLNEGLMAAVLLAAWVMLTGALHLDGFADCIDGAYAGHKSPTDIKKIMKDPHCGSMAVVALMVLLLVKWQAIVAIIAKYNSPVELFMVLTCVMALARLSATLFVYSTPYVSNGLAKTISDKPSVLALAVSVSGLILLFLIMFSLQVVIYLGVLTGIIMFAWRQFWMKRIQGYNGDVLGANIEIVEAVLLVFLVGVTH